MKFVQFYPTATGRLGNKLILYETLVLGKGAVLKNRDGEDIIFKHGLKDSMRLTRDRPIRAIMRELLGGATHCARFLPFFGGGISGKRGCRPGRRDGTCECTRRNDRT